MNVKFNIVLLLSMSLLIQCEKPEKIVKVKTLDIVAEDISYYSAKVKGEIVDAGDNGADDHGFIISEFATLDLSNSNKESLGLTNSKGEFEHTFDDLTSNTIYYFRAYATSGEKEVLGATKQFKTHNTESPIINPVEIEDITTQEAVVTVSLASDGGLEITSIGVIWSFDDNPSLDTFLDSIMWNPGSDQFIKTITELKCDSSYYAKAFATNSKGTAYSPELSFKMIKCPTEPVVTTNEISDLNMTSVRAGGIITDIGGYPITDKGFCWSLTSKPTINDDTISFGSGETDFGKLITDLAPGTNYFLRAFATNSIGTGYGEEVSFKTHNIPELLTTPISQLTETSALSGATLSWDGGSSIISSGLCWNGTGNPTTDNNTTSETFVSGTFTSLITNLVPETTYYLRSYAENVYGIAYGDEISFTTNAFAQVTGTFTDSRTSTTYDWVQIGNEVWMSENLAYLPEVYPPSDGSATEKRFYVYGYNGSDSTSAVSEANYSTYGVLYNWSAATNMEGSSSTNPSGLKGICPTGWHIPSKSEWDILIAYLGGTDVAGGRLKEVGTTYWTDPNTGATNESGFSALGSGKRDNSDIFDALGNSGYAWSSTAFDSQLSWRISVNNSSTTVSMYNALKEYGFPVRCIQNKVPSVQTNSSLNIHSESLVVGGEVLNEGRSPVTARGVCWNTSGSPTISDNFTLDETGKGEYISFIENLSPNSTYYYRAYATNEYGTSYGEILSCTTSNETNLSIGDYYAGGIVFYLDGAGGGLVCTEKEIGWAGWGCFETWLGGTSQDFGTGEANTNLIVTKCSATNSAAYRCQNLTRKGFNDWYLPSIDELSLIMTELFNAGIGNLNNGTYWSSSEASHYFAHSLRFYDAYYSQYYEKYRGFYLVPVRNF